MIDYSIHSWDIKVGLGREEPLSDDAAITLIPFMLIVMQYTVDPRHTDLKTRFGIEVEGSGGGSWTIDIDGQSVTVNEGALEGREVIFDFDPNDFVLSTYQRRRGGSVRGNEELAERVRDLLFKI